MKKKVCRIGGTLCSLFALMVLVGASLATAGEVVLYTASNPKIEKDINAAFQKAYPDITVKAVNMSTGPITERAIAEKANPQADVIWMVNDIALEQLKKAGVLEPYEPKDSPVVEEFKDPDGFYVNHNATLMGMAVNTKLLKERNLPVPTTWEDLIKPIYKGQISIAAPTKSGTGLSIFSTLVDAFGWNFVDNLHQNIFSYQSSGSAAARMAGRGEIAIGLSYDTAILQQVRAGVPVEMVIGRISPNVKEGGGLLLGAPHPKEAKIFMDWLFSAEAAKVFGPEVGIGAVPGYGNIDVSKVHLWKMRRPLDATEFKRQWASKYEK
ncbi:MAG: extracellular solute-binding protein [Anaerolineales bacterium]|nr:extracellular solute-binding protein [Deltaproteobacteria bacterium]NIS79737.1 extracellular solute-binding protein [Anaerolineales bacterium]